MELRVAPKTFFVVAPAPAFAHGSNGQLLWDLCHVTNENVHLFLIIFKLNCEQRHIKFSKDRMYANIYAVMVHIVNVGVLYS